HEEPAATIAAVGDAIARQLDDLDTLSGGCPEALLDARYAKYRAMGRWSGGTWDAGRGTRDAGS
ncbi:MAG TPA: hypothetical protein PKA95_11410, partial [Thermomicrobiales bacterium]|nr:hypothetical protein [Thermomicrobiales bacterium]